MTCSTGPSCTACPAAGSSDRIALNVQVADAVVALAGNPNTGKSTVFNTLTGLRQHTGNWPGKTVTRAEGTFTHAGRRYRLIDLPGTYSLLSATDDEQVARDFILFAQPDCTVVVADATALERNLNLVLQVVEITDKVVLCVNLMDEARRKGVSVDIDQLSAELGVPVVPTVARRGKGLDELMDTVAGVIDGSITTQPHRISPPTSVQQAIDELLPMIESLAPGLPNARWVAFRLLEGDLSIGRALQTGELARLAARARNTEVDSVEPDTIAEGAG